MAAVILTGMRNGRRRVGDCDVVWRELDGGGRGVMVMVLLGLIKYGAYKCYCWWRWWWNVDDDSVVLEEDADDRGGGGMLEH